MEEGRNEFSRDVFEGKFYWKPITMTGLYINWPWKREKITEIWRWPIIFWMYFFGWWAEEAPTASSRKWLSRFRILCFINATICFWSLICAIIVRFSEGDIMVNLFSVFGAGPGISGAMKIVQSIRYRKPLKDAMDLLDDMMSEIDEPEVEPIVRKGMKKCWIVFVLCLFFGTCISLHWLIRPLLLLIFYGERTRILDTWPVFDDNWLQWSLTFVFQATNVCHTGHTFYIFDNVYFCISESLLCQLKVLEYRLTHLKLDGSMRSEEKLDKYIKQHIQILKVCAKLKFASEAVIIFQCICTAIMICTGIFILSLMDHISFNIILNLGEITLVIIVILFLYCWYSNEITFQCSELASYAYMMDWMGGTLSQKKKLLNLMTMPMQPMIFGGIVEINLNTFINVLKTAFSYYNFLVAADAGGDNGK